jgi:glycerate 2-kinase
VGSSRELLERCFRAALARVAAGPALERFLGGDGSRLIVAGAPLPPDARVFALAAGKAAAPMAAALESWAGDRIARALCVTKAGHGIPLRRFELLESAHPVPDARSEAAGGAALALAAEANAQDVLLVLLSGGASALLARPLPGLSLADVQRTTALLLECGADIGELNTVRKHLTAVSGGRLARATGAGRVEVLALSDVPGDDPAVLASGPCAGDPSSASDAWGILARRGLAERVPVSVRAHVESRSDGRSEESVKPGDPTLARVRFTLLGSNRDACAAAAEEAERSGAVARPFGAELAGEARQAARKLVSFARSLGPGPEALVVAGGETTVTVSGGGRGGRNQELALAAALELEGDPALTLLAAGTDGTDGPTDAAGAFADGKTVERGRRAGVSASVCLDANDSYRFFSAEGGHLHTGPTGTNVMDLVLVHVAASAG